MNINKPLIIFVAILVAALSVLGWFLSRPQGSLQFILAPHSINVTINDKQQTITHNERITLPPATYKITFKADGFETTTKTVVVENKKTKRVVMALTPLTDTAKKQLRDSAESQAVIKEYQDVRYQDLQASLPLSGVDYTVNSCQSIKQPKSDKKAICITAKTSAGEASARSDIQAFGFDLSTLEILTGTENIRTITSTDTYKVEYYVNANPEAGTGKTALFITPINAPVVPYTATNSPELETIRTAALSDLKAKGYDLNNYDFFYNDFYLSKYNPGNDAPAEHAMPPSYN